VIDIAFLANRGHLLGAMGAGAVCKELTSTCILNGLICSLVFAYGPWVALLFILSRCVLKWCYDLDLTFSRSSGWRPRSAPSEIMIYRFWSWDRD